PAFLNKLLRNMRYLRVTVFGFHP
ncbi:chlamydia polymorphic membrane middle domain protein, partial [Chlamydia psittaci C1/97]